ncbi:MAG: SPFH domain-containing protein [Planctomycetes bacterium]|nr:SPFH domain-containing protein [Planctomycetota bacterium]
MGYVLAFLFVGGALAVAIYQVLTNLIYICSPNEVLVFSGGTHSLRGGKTVGYRVVKGGRATRIPFFETVDRMDLTNMNIDVSVKGAFSKGGIALNVEGIANVKIAGESPALDNALQRLMGKPKPVIMRIAKDTLEGYLRGVLASLTPSDVNENTQAFEKALREQAGEGFERLGLTLDNLKIQSISDDVGYLAAVGRISAAQLQRDNRVAEAQRRAESLVEQADSRKRGELAKINAQLSITRAEAARRVANAKTAGQAYVAEQQGEVAALLTRAKADLALQEARIEQARHQLEAEVITPARKDMEARISQARGDAAPILETGRARATALRDLATQWHQAGGSAKDVFLLQRLETILPTFLDSIRRVRVSEFTMLQGGGQAGGLPSQAVATVKALEAGGIDVAGILNRLGGAAPAERPPAPATLAPPPPRPQPPPPPAPPAPRQPRAEALQLEIPSDAFAPVTNPGEAPPRARLIQKPQQPRDSRRY